MSLADGRGLAEGRAPNRLVPEVSPYSLTALQAAARTVSAVMPPTPQYRWPLLEAGFARQPGDGTQVWLKHENHTPVGAFKLRGGLVYLDRLMRAAVHWDNPGR